MALCLTRRPDESIILRTKDGLAIKIVVAEFTRSNAVRLAIHAPESVEVVREELLYETTNGFRRGKDTHGKVIR